MWSEMTHFLGTPFSERDVTWQNFIFNLKDFPKFVLNFTYSRRQPKNFAFDHCFNSVDSGDPTFAGQEQVFQCLGHDILDNAFQGYNACIFAYGQTGIKKII